MCNHTDMKFFSCADCIATLDMATEEMNEAAAFMRDSDAANAYVDRESAKFIERIKRNVVKRWGDVKITSACFRESDDYSTDAGIAHIVAKHVIMAIGGECC
jgi:hypothetical protein